jgi:hypothetical protein
MTTAARVASVKVGRKDTPERGVGSDSSRPTGSIQNRPDGAEEVDQLNFVLEGVALLDSTPQ